MEKSVSVSRDKGRVVITPDGASRSNVMNFFVNWPSDVSYRCFDFPDGESNVYVGRAAQLRPLLVMCMGTVEAATDRHDSLD